MSNRQLNVLRSAPGATALALTLMGAALRMRGLFVEGLHADEALFASWARLIGTGQDMLLSGQAVDKPPLLFYLQALHYPLLGTPEAWVARLPNLAFSIALVPLTARLVWNLYGDSLATVAAATIVTFSPLLVRFSATAFTDPLLTGLLLASLVVASAKARAQYGVDGRAARTFVMGLLLGAAMVTKYQAILFAPLHFGLGGLNGLTWRDWRRWGLGATLPIVAVIAWQGARGGAGGLWSEQMSSFGGLRLAWSWELWSRLEAWGALWGGLIGAPVLGFALLLFTPVFLALLIQKQDRATALDQLLLLFLSAYALLHWFFAVPTWERYLLPAAPLAAALLGRFISRVLAFVQPAVPLPPRTLAAGVALALLVMVAPAGVEAREATSGARQRVAGATQGAAAVAEALADAPYGTVLYDHWYSWHWRYYLMDSGVYVSWFAHPAALVEDLNVFFDDGAPRYVTLPREPAARVVQRHLRGAGYDLALVVVDGDMTLYRIRR